MTQQGLLTRRTFFASAAVAVALPALLAGCDSGAASTAQEESQKRRVALVLNSSISDGGWGSSCYDALVGAAEKLGWESAYSDNLDQADWANVMRNYCEEGYDLLFMSSDTMDETVETVAKEYPDSRFCILASNFYADNVEGMLPDNDDIGYLAGTLAALLTKTNSIAFVGGVEVFTTTGKADAYERAAKAINPDIVCTTVYANTYTDVAKGKEIAESLISSNNTDVIYGDASAVDSGIRETLSAHEGTYNIGQPSDLGSADDPVIACSVITDNQVMLEQCMKDVENGNFGGRLVDGTIENGAISVGTISDAIVSADVKAAYLELIDRIADGTFDPQ